MVNVLAFNCSPCMEKGTTASILSPFVDGMSQAGALVELFYIAKLKINPCTSGFYCWFGNPGKCYQDDDMNMLYPKLRNADIWVFATPLYWDGMTGHMKTLIDRMQPLLEPYFELRNGHFRHSPLQKTKHKVVLISSCSFWEMDNFEPLLVHIKAICKNLNMEFAGAMLRPHAMALTGITETNLLIKNIFEADRTAGYQLVTNGKISTETQKKFSSEIIPRQKYLRETNKRFRQVLESNK